MLKKTYKANEILTIRLVGGDEMIGRFDSTDSETITLSKAAMLAVQHVQTTQGPQAAVGLAPTSYLASEDPKQWPAVTLKLDHILYINPAPSGHELTQQYTQIMSGIQMPTGGDVSALKL